MLQDDVALADVVKNLSEQLQQVQRQFQLQLAEQQAINVEQQATITEQQAVIDSLIENDVNMKEIITEQAQQVDRLTDNFARLEAEHKVIAALHVQDNGTEWCMSVTLKPFSSVSLSAKYFKIKCMARSLILSPF